MAKNKYWSALKAAFPHTIPILAGFLFLGMSYGMYANNQGFNVWYSFFMSTLIFAGSVEFLAISFLLNDFQPLTVLLMTLVVNFRHFFYGLSMLDKYKGTGWKKYYLIFGMCDESFSINYTAHIPEEVDRGWFMFFVTLLNQLYWVGGAVLGSLLGANLQMDLAGFDFVMTALFIVLFLENFLDSDNHFYSYLGIGISLACLLLFGPEVFLLPALCAMLGVIVIKDYQQQRGSLS